jgi:60 kDa SS-A/Ro ribonucleoprotein
MTRYAQYVNDRQTSQRESARADQVENSAGGFVFVVDEWTRLDRFLILGAEGGTYYVGEKKLATENVTCLKECIAKDGVRTVARIVAISDSGRAIKNEPAIFALAVCAAATDGQGRPDDMTRAAAIAAIPKVCRTGTHLLHFVNDVKQLRGLGPALRNGLAGWFTGRSPGALAMQIIKYQQRDGWSQRDVLRLAHPKAPTPAHRAIFAWSARSADKMSEPTRKKGGTPDQVRALGVAKSELPAVIQAFEEIHSGVSASRAVALILEHKLPHECVPNELKNKPEVWEAMLEHMGPEAMIRQLAKMTAVGLLAPMSAATAQVAKVLTDTSRLFAARLHPMRALLALKNYGAGHGDKGSLRWNPLRAIMDALDECFYLCFQTIEPTGKRRYLALDVSGSMGATINNTNLTCREAVAALALVTARTEKQYHIGCFAACGDGRIGGMHGGGDPRLVSLTISPRQRLDDVIAAAARIPMGGTDCSLPMRWALENKIDFDSFEIHTDNETWAGPIHPFQALRVYREKRGIPAKLVVNGMTSTAFTIADPTDAGMLDVVGFDAAAPGIVADFVAGREVQK